MENNIDNIQIGDYTLKEWEEQAKAPPISSTVSFNDAEGLGLMQPEPQSQEEKDANKFYNALDTIGIEHPDADKEYEKLNAWDTTIDVTKSLFTEASHIFAPKDKELQYESRTHFGENVKYGYRYIAGAAGFMLGGEVVGGIKGLGWIGKLLSGSKLINPTRAGLKAARTGKNAKTAMQGAKIFNATFSGALAGALADFTLYRPEENEGHLADVFGHTDNALLSYLQSKDTDTDLNAKLKNVVEGLVMGMGIGNIVEFGAKPLFKTALKTLKALKDGKKGALEAVVQDQINLERFASKADLLETVENIKAEAEANGTEASQLLIDRLHPTDNPEAQQMLKILNDGEEIFVHSDGTWDISVNKWDDAYKVSPEEYKKQLLARDMAQDGYAGDTAISHQDAAVKETWTNRGWIGEYEKLTNKNANKIAKNYKDKFEIDNNIKIEFVAGLTVNGKAVEGNTQATKYLGKNKKPKGKLSDITIQIDTNAKNPYATLRAELEHARDIAKGEVPDKNEKHFSRYNGLNEGEVAPEYVYKKAQGKAKAIGQIKEIQNISENVQKYELEGYKFETSEPLEGAGEQRYNLVDTNGNNLGYVEYTIKDGILDIGEVRNQTKRIEDWKTGEKLPKQESDLPSTPNVAEKLIDKVISENPNLKIKWDAVTKPGMAFKEKYLQKHPNLKDKVEGISTKKELDTLMKNEDDNTIKGGSNGTQGNQSGYRSGYSEGVGQSGLSHDTVQTGRNSKNAGERILDTEGNLYESDTRTDSRGKITNSDVSSPQQLQLDFNSSIETKQSTGDIVTGIVNGEVKPTTKADIETLVSKVEKLNPEINGFNWQAVVENPEAYIKEIEKIFTEEDTSGLIEALAKGDIDSLEKIVKKELAAVKIIGELHKTIKAKGLDLDDDAQIAIIDSIHHLGGYIKGIKSGFGSGLQAQKGINEVLESYGASRLSSWTKEGIDSFAQKMVDKLNDIISLNFTRGQKLTPLQVKQQLAAALLEDPETHNFMAFLSQNKDMSMSFALEVEKIMTKKGTITKEEGSQALKKILMLPEYKAQVKAAQLAPDDKQFFKTINDWMDGNGGITSYYVHNLLSGVGSLAKNIGSGAINTLYFPARKILASLDPFIDQATRESLGAEGYRTYKCMLQSWMESWQLMKEAFITGNGKLTDIGENTLNITDGKFQGYHELQKIDYYFQDPSKFWEGMQNLHSLMTRAMGATDEFMSQLNYRSIARSKALQEAERNAIEAGMKDNELWINEEADKIFKSKFDNHGKPTDVESLNEARTILYQNNLDGTMYNYQKGTKEQMRDPSFVMKLAGKLQGMANENAFMKCMFPFVKTGANILQMSLDHNALYMAASPLQRKLLTAQTAEGALARSQCAFGMFSLAIGAMMAFNGMITGSAPSDPKERKALFATGWKPYSFKVGDSYISYQGYEPLHGMLGFAADCANMYSTITNSKDEARLEHFRAQILPTLVNNFLDKAAFRTGLSQLDLLLNPQDADEWDRAMAQTTKGFLPDVAFITNTKSVGEHDVLQPKTFYERVFYRYFPEKWTPMDYRRNVFGEKQSITGLIATSASQVSNTPEEEALEYLSRYGYTPSEIDDVIANTGLRISNFKDSETGRSAMDAMKEEMSTVTIQGMTLREAVRALVTSEEYQSLPDGVDLDTGARWGSSEDTKINAINDIFLMYKQRAKKNIMNDSDYFTDSDGRTMQEAVSDIQLKRLQQLNNLY